MLLRQVAVVIPTLLLLPLPVHLAPWRMAGYWERRLSMLLRQVAVVIAMLLRQVAVVMAMLLLLPLPVRHAPWQMAGYGERRLSILLRQVAVVIAMLLRQVAVVIAMLLRQVAVVIAMLLLLPLPVHLAPWQMAGYGMRRLSMLLRQVAVVIAMLLLLPLPVHLAPWQMAGTVLLVVIIMLRMLLQCGGKGLSTNRVLVLMIMVAVFVALQIVTMYRRFPGVSYASAAVKLGTMLVRVLSGSIGWVFTRPGMLVVRLLVMVMVLLLPVIPAPRQQTSSSSAAVALLYKAFLALNALALSSTTWHRFLQHQSAGLFNQRGHYWSTSFCTKLAMLILQWPIITMRT
jgi:hypothetical protein